MSLHQVIFLYVDKAFLKLETVQRDKFRLSCDPTRADIPSAALMRTASPCDCVVLRVLIDICGTNCVQQ